MSRYIANIITKSPATPTGPNPITGRAPGVWRMEDVAYWLKQGVWPDASADGYWPYTSLLLPGNGSNGAQNNTFLDSSTNNFTITRNGNTTQGSFSPYGSYWSNYFDGAGDYLTIPDSTALNLAGGTFTLEAWVYPDGNYSKYRTIISKRILGGGSASYQMYLRITTGYLSFYNGSAEFVSSSVPTANAWNHVAAVYDGTNINLYLNGTRVLQTAVTITNVSASIYIGSFPTYDETLIGYLSNVRILKGVQAYTGTTYTVPTAPLTAISGTSLLTCQSNRFIDNSSNAFTITVNGDTKVQKFSPFTPASVNAYSTTANGGSAYFDGSGDYLTSAASSAYAMGTGNFTIEGWYFISSSKDQALFDNRDFSSSSSGIGCRLINSTNTLRVILNNTALFTTSQAVTLNQWNHIAIVRASGTVTAYLNGTAMTGGSASGATNITDTNMWIGELQDTGYQYNGYISNFRVVKGTAVYTSAFTPPTAPVTAISGTSLLLNATNAGIYDATTINDMETVGNAQVSTSVSKFGGSSMYFDGTGDWLTTASNNTLSMGTGNFTAEMWVYPTSVTSYRILIDNSWDTATYAWQIFINAGTVSVYAANGAGANLNVDSTSTVSANVWTHIAVVKSGTTVTIYLNGTASGSGTMNTTFGRDAVNYVGAQAGTPYAYEGYIDDLRITKGVARYTSNFTPPTQAFPTY